MPRRLRPVARSTRSANIGPSSTPLEAFNDGTRSEVDDEGHDEEDDSQPDQSLGMEGLIRLSKLGRNDRRQGVARRQDRGIDLRLVADNEEHRNRLADGAG